MMCLVLAGGLGTRMASYTQSMPKALIPVGGVPFIDLQIAWLASHGVTEIVMSVGYRAAMLAEHLGDGRRFGVPIRYVDEGTELRGTGGALRFALEQGALTEHFLVTYGDSFLPVDFGQVASAVLASKKPAAMTVLQNGGRWDASNVVFEGGRLVVYDKRHKTRPSADFHFIDYGLLGLSRRVVEERIPKNAPGEKHDLADVLHELSLEGELFGIEVEPRFYEIGSPAGLDDFTAWVKDKRAKGELSWARGVG